MSNQTQLAIKLIRHRRAWELVHSRFGGVLARFAAAIDKPPSQVRTWLHPESAGGRYMGEKMARHIESKLDLPPSWMDEGENSTSFQVAGLLMKELEDEGIPEQQVVSVLNTLLETARAFKNKGP